MRICIDFDGTIVRQDRAYADLSTPLEFIDGAKEGLLALKRSGHLLILWSGRASRALLYDPLLDPLVRAGAVPFNRKHWLESRHLHRARYEQMISFLERELPGVFDAIDDGLAGKPHSDLFVDDRAMPMRGASSWSRLSRVYGESEPPVDQQPLVALLDRPVESLHLVPTGELKNILEQLRAELEAQGIAYEPTYVLGQAGFWAADRATTVNIPWFLASEQLREAALPRYPWTWNDVARSLRHELGHSINYAFELWKRADWTVLFGDFLLPYPKHGPDEPVDARENEFVEYVPGVERLYGARHPDEDFAETFACWLDPQSAWREQYPVGTGARAKLDYVDRTVLSGDPPNRELGPYREWREAYRGQTVGQALAIPNIAKEPQNAHKHES